MHPEGGSAHLHVASAPTDKQSQVQHGNKDNSQKGGGGGIVHFGLPFSRLQLILHPLMQFALIAMHFAPYLSNLPQQSKCSKQPELRPLCTRKKRKLTVPVAVLLEPAIVYNEQV